MSVETTVADFDVSRETFSKLQAYEALVRKWTPAINLISKNTVPDLWNRHIADSAQIFAACPKDATTWVDIGSGGGFPGIVVAILAQEFRPGLRVTLVESDLRKATFLRQSGRELGLGITVAAERAENLPPQRADVVSARALAPLVDLLPLACLHMRPEGVAIFPKGARAAVELEDARKLWAFEVDSRPSLSDSDATILVIRNIHRARND
jgi:16S rRNA (guanine527-N7)-methyltransferase